MQPAADKLAAYINSIAFKKPEINIVNNVDVAIVNNPDEIKTNLIAQLTSPVRWTQSVEHMIADGAKSFVEVGPGKVLQGLVAKIDKAMQTEGVS